MKAENLGFDLTAMIEPKSHADFMALAHEALNELKIFNGHLANIRADAAVGESA